MSQATFYILPQGRSAAEHACQLAAEFYRAGQTVYIHTDSQRDAEAVDEQLWQFEPDSFVPHNLLGEGWAPVVISWQPTLAKRRHVLINLSQQVPQFARQFGVVVDFVPYDEHLKALARERFKAYRQQQIVPKTSDLSR